MWNHHDDHDDFGGLHRDIAATRANLDRRRLLRVVTGLGLGVGGLQVLGCDKQSPTAPTTTTSTTTTTTTTPAPSGMCSRIPEETAGPYPGDGSNGPSVLGLADVVRNDIRASFGGLSGRAEGVPLQIVLTIVSASTCEPAAGRAVYLWQCDREGRYSLYTPGVTNQNYLRGVQQADASGRVTFTSIYPGCYSGRWPHIHFEVYPSLAAASRAANKSATSQIALPKDTSDLVYATTGYAASVTNLSRITLATDMVFRDGVNLELATVTGSVESGLVAMLTVAV